MNLSSEYLYEKGESRTETNSITPVKELEPFQFFPPPPPFPSHVYF